MPLPGYLPGCSLQSVLDSMDHWFSLGLLAIIGINMIRESCRKIERLDASFPAKSMFPLVLQTA